MIPALRAALICEKVLTDADGVMSAIRIFSRLDLPPGATYDATLLLMLATVAPEAKPDHQVLVRLESITGETLGRQQFAITSPLEAGEAFSLILPFRFQAPARETTFWLRLAYDHDEHELTRLRMQFRQPREVTV
jgi:hypothetical protein